VSGSSTGPSSGFEVFVPGRQDGFGHNPVYRSAHLICAHRSHFHFAIRCDKHRSTSRASQHRYALGKNQQSAVCLTLTVNRVGHIEARGRYEINENGLDFTFKTDQTQLGPLRKWLDGILVEYGRKAA